MRACYSQDEISHFLHDASRASSSPQNPRESILASVSNNIATLIFGDRLPYSHPKRQDLNRFLFSFVKASSYFVLSFFVPGLQMLLEYFGVREIRDMHAAANRAHTIFE